MHWLLALLLVFAPTVRIMSRAAVNTEQALRAYDRGSSEFAMRLATEAIDLDPSHAPAHAALAHIHAGEGRHAQAVAAYQAGLAVLGKDHALNPTLRYDLAVVLLAHSDLDGVPFTKRTALKDKAIAALDEVLARNAKHHEARHRRGRAHDWLDHANAAEADYRECIQLKPSYVPCFVSLAALYVDYGFSAQGLAVLEAGQAHNGKDAAMWTGTGRVYSQLDRPRDAIAAYEKARTIDPGLVQVLFGLGMAHAELRQRKQAVENLQAFLRRAPPDVSKLQLRTAADTLARMHDVI